MASDESWERDRQVLLAQLHNLTLALRSNTKFSSRARLLDVAKATEHALTAGVQQMRAKLCQPALSGRVEWAEAIKPFVDVAVSDETTEPITGVALAAFVAFLDLKCDFITTESLVAMAECAQNSRSEVMDPASHEAILARILQVYVGCVRHPAGHHLDETHIINMLESTFVVASQGNPSELLRRTAEQAMNDIVSSVFEHVVSAPPGTPGGAKCCYAAVLTYICRLVGGNHESDPVLAASTQLQGLCLAHTALFVLKDDICSEPLHALLQTIRNDLSRALLQVGRHTHNVVVLSQMLRTMHLLISFASIRIVPQFLSFLVAVHLTDSQTPGSPVVPAPVDIERRERAEMMMESLLEFCADGAFPTFVFVHYDLGLEYKRVFVTLSDFLSRHCVQQVEGEAAAPGVNQIHVLALDCILALLWSIQRRVRTLADASGSLPLDDARLVRLQEMQAQKDRLLKFADLFAEKPKKAVAFIRTPPEGCDVDAFGMGPDSSPADLAVFLARHASILDVAALADFLSELGREPPAPEDPAALALWEAARVGDVMTPGTVRFHAALLPPFMRQFQFRGRPLLAAVRELVSNMGMPGESQKIDRIMEAFATHWHASNTGAPESLNPFATPDAAFILSFSSLMLNTDLHSGKMDKTMTKEGFLSMNRGINDGKDLPAEYLSRLYDDVKAHKIDLINVVQKGFDDDATWFQEVDDSIAIASEHDTAISMRGSDPSVLLTYDPSIFALLWRPAVAAFSGIIDAAAPGSTDEAAVVRSALSGFERCGDIAAALSRSDVVDHVVLTLEQMIPLELRTAFTDLAAIAASPKAQLACRALFRVLPSVGDAINEAWPEVARVLTKLLLVGAFATAEDSDVTDPLLRNPGVVQRPAASSSQDGGWFGFWGGSPKAASAEEPADPAAALRDSAPTIDEIIRWTTTLSDRALARLLDALSTVASPEGPSVNAFVASHVAHLVAEIAARNVQRLRCFAPTLTEYLELLLTTTTNEAHTSHAPHDRSNAVRSAEALMRLLRAVATTEDSGALVRFLRVVQGLPEDVRSDIAPVVARTLSDVVCGRSADGSRRPFQSPDEETWTSLIAVLDAVAQAAPTKGTRQRCAFTLLLLVQDAHYVCPAAVRPMCDALTALSLGDTLPGEAEETEWTVSLAELTPNVDAVPSTPLRMAENSNPCYEDHVVPALVVLHSRLVAELAGSHERNEGWVAAWHGVLQSMTAVCLACAASGQSRRSSDALLALQRCLLDPGLCALATRDVHALFQQILFPLVERVCSGHSLEASAHGATGARSLLSPSVLLSSVFGPMAGREPVTDKPDRQTHFPEEVRCRTVSLLSRAVLHFVGALASDTRSFLPLWERVFTLLYAVHSLPATAATTSEPGLLKEAVQEGVRNVIFVTTAMQSQAEHAAVFAPFPTFWQRTRHVLQPFGFSEALLHHLNELSLH